MSEVAANLVDGYLSITGRLRRVYGAAEKRKWAARFLTPPRRKEEGKWVLISAVASLLPLNEPYTSPC